MVKETKISDLKQREVRTLERINAAQNSSKVLKAFFEKGFTSFEALKAIVMNYRPDVIEKRLWDYWHFRIVDQDLTDALEDTLEKLKSE